MKDGYITIKSGTEGYATMASVPGIFAAGDVRHGSVKRVATAVGEGAVAVKLIHQHLRRVCLFLVEHTRSAVFLVVN